MECWLEIILKMKFKKICEKFNGKLTKNGCLVDGYNLDNAIYLFNHKPFSQVHKTMSPDEFLKLAPRLIPNNPKIQEELKNKIKNKKPIDPLFLDVDIDKCKVLGHEGRNRSVIAKELGIKKVPVIIFKKQHTKEGGMFGQGGDYYSDKKYKCKKLLPEN